MLGPGFTLHGRAAGFRVHMYWVQAGQLGSGFTRGGRRQRGRFGVQLQARVLGSGFTCTGGQAGGRAGQGGAF